MQALSFTRVRDQTNPEGESMAKFPIKASYSAEGAKGLLEEGGTARRTTVEKAAVGIGGKVEAFYFAFGEGGHVPCARFLMSHRD
jgi:uncharacterized protein with GYD domain